RDAHCLRLALHAGLGGQDVGELAATDPPGQCPQRADGAAVAVAAAQGEPGQRDPELGRDHMHDAVARLADLQHGYAEIARLFAQVGDERVGEPARVVARRIGGDRMIGHREHELGPRKPDAAGPQLRERARRQVRDDQAIDMHESEAVAIVGHDVPLPDLVEQGARLLGHRDASRKAVSGNLIRGAGARKRASHACAPPGQAGSAGRAAGIRPCVKALATANYSQLNSATPRAPMLQPSTDTATQAPGWRRERVGASLSEVYGSVTVRSTGPVWKRLLAFLGPGYLVAVGYMDPGNWATSLAAGSKFGYALLSMALLSNIMAIVLQALCTRLGIGAGRDLAQACRDAFPRAVSIPLWAAAEIAICATDLAEVIGTAI